jgi:MFS family permease
MAAFVFPMALLTYPAGRLSDRWGRLTPLAVGSVLFGIVFASYGLLDAGSLWIAMVASGVLSAIMFAPSLALCRDLAPDSIRTTAFAGFNAAGSLGFLSGPLLGMAVTGGLGGAIGFDDACRWTFVIAGASEVLCAVLSIPFLIRLAARMKAVRPAEE